MRWSSLFLSMFVSLAGACAAQDEDGADEASEPSCPDKVVNECTYNMCGRDNDCPEDFDQPCEITSCNALYWASEEECFEECFANHQCDEWARYHECREDCYAALSECETDSACDGSCEATFNECDAACTSPDEAA